MDDEPGREDDGRGARTWGTIAAALAVVVVTGGIAYVHHRAGEPRPTASEGRSVNVTAYFLGRTASGQRLFAEQHSLTGVTGTDLQAAVTAALGNPDDPDYHSGFPAGTTATATDHDTYVSIDFGSRDVIRAPAHRTDPAMALQALVWTADQVAQRPIPVRFTVDGIPATRLLGVPVRRQIAPGSEDGTLSPVSVHVGEGATITRGSLVQGRANAFEATVEWQLRQGEQVVRHGFTTATTCCKLAPFQLRLTAPPGNYTLAVRDTDPSGGEGNGVTADTKDIVLR